MRVHYAHPVLGLSAIRSRTFRNLFAEYERRLFRTGYHHKVARLHLHSIAHLGVWVERENRSLKTIDEPTLLAFGRHRSTCTCPGTSRNGARQVLSCVRRFVQHLRERGVVRIVAARPQPVRWVQGFLRWMQVHRGVVESTLTSYGSYVGDLVRFLGDDPRTYTARGCRDFVEQRCRHYRSTSSRMVLAAVRMFLRYLAVEGECRPGLEHALTPIANWSQQSLPRGALRPETGRLHLIAAHGLPAELNGVDVVARPRSISEWVFRNGRGLVLDGEVRDARFESSAPRTGIESSVCVPLAGAAGPIGALSLARRAPAERFTELDCAALAASLEPVAEALERVRRSARAERSFRGLEATNRAATHSMIPAGASEFLNWQLALARRPSWGLAGDLCDRVPHEGGANTLLVADVSGSSACAAQTAAFVQGMFTGASVSQRSASGLVAQIDGALLSRFGDGRYAALWLAQLTRGGEVVSCLAGSPPPFWVPRDGSGVRRLGSGGPVAGVIERARYEEERARLLPGDLLVAVSDGVLGECDGPEDCFGERRVADLLHDLRHEPPERITREVIEAACAFSGRSIPTDDCTVLAVRYQPER